MAASITTGDRAAWAAPSDGRNHALRCPVRGSLLRDAVVLMPCGHTISELAAERLYCGEICGEVEQQAPCPSCPETVKAYYPNPTVRTLANAIEVDLDTIPFPGKSAEFVLISGDWDQTFDSGADQNRIIEFSSIVKESLFTKVSLFGYKDGSVRLFVEYENSESVRAYLLDCGIVIDPVDKSFYKSDQHTTPLLFKILTMHNEFPEGYVQLMHDAIASQKVDPTIRSTSSRSRFWSLLPETLLQTLP